MAGEILFQGLSGASENIQKSQERVNRAKATSKFLEFVGPQLGIEPDQIQGLSVGDLDAFAEFIPQLIQGQQVGVSQQRQALEQKKFQRTTERQGTQEAFAIAVSNEAQNRAQGGEADPTLDRFVEDQNLVNVGNAIIQGGSGAVSDEDLQASITPDANVRIKQEQAAVNLQESQLKLQQLEEEVKFGKKVDIKPQELRKEFSGLGEVKDFRKVDAAFNKVKTAATGKRSPAKDLALVFNFMKILDPNSVVRESEFKTAAKARAELELVETKFGVDVPVGVKQAIDRLVQGTILTDAQTQDFLNTAEGAFNGQLETVLPAIEQFRDLATLRGFEPGVILSKRDLKLFDEFQTGAAVGAAEAATPVEPQADFATTISALQPDDQAAVQRALDRGVSQEEIINFIKSGGQ